MATFNFGDKVKVWHSDAEYVFLQYVEHSGVKCADIIAKGSRTVECLEVSDIEEG
jgi:hypothetical protein